MSTGTNLGGCWLHLVVVVLVEFVFVVEHVLLAHENGIQGPVRVPTDDTDHHTMNNTRAVIITMMNMIRRTRTMRIHTPLTM